jgi:hypothetical protein
MFTVQKIDGGNLVTDKGCASLAPFLYADVGKSKPVSRDDFLRMRALFVVAPALLQQLGAISDALDLGETVIIEPGSVRHAAIRKAMTIGK